MNRSDQRLVTAARAASQALRDLAEAGPGGIRGGPYAARQLAAIRTLEKLASSVEPVTGISRTARHQLAAVVTSQWTEERLLAWSESWKLLAEFEEEST
jgi:hypothetical protein